MKTRPTLLLLGKIVLGVVAVGAATGAAFAAWVENGDQMLASMFQAGLAWCM